MQSLIRRLTKGFFIMAILTTFAENPAMAAPKDSPKDTQKDSPKMPPPPESPGGSKSKMCGGSETWQDPKAPAHIESRDIVLFDLESSFTTIVEPETDLKFVKTFVIPLENEKNDKEGTVLAGLYVESRPGRRGPAPKEGRYIRAAVLPSAIFTELQQVVEKYNFIKKNGYSHHTHGLPENFGGFLTVKYATDESISFSDNQTPIMGPAAGEAIVRTLRRFLDSPKKGKVLSPDELNEIFEKKIGDKYPAWRIRRFIEVYRRTQDSTQK